MESVCCLLPMQWKPPLPHVQKLSPPTTHWVIYIIQVRKNLVWHTQMTQLKHTDPGIVHIWYIHIKYIRQKDIFTITKPTLLWWIRKVFLPLNIIDSCQFSVQWKQTCYTGKIGILHLFLHTFSMVYVI